MASGQVTNRLRGKARPAERERLTPPCGAPDPEKGGAPCGYPLRNDDKACPRCGGPMPVGFGRDV